MSLAYYAEQDGEFRPIYQYTRFAIEPDEIIAHQLCEYHVIQGAQYALKSNEMNGEYDQLIVEYIADDVRKPDEKVYPPHQIHLEFRTYRGKDDYPLLKTMTVPDHVQAMRYLVKDMISLDQETYERDSCEIDIDRNCYVVYLGKKVS